MKSKGTQTMQKIVIKKPWGVEIKDYKAGDPIPAGVKFKIFDAKDTAKIEAYAESLDESADYQKKRFKEPYYMYNESVKTIKESSETKKDYLKYIDQFEKDVKKYIEWMKRDVKENKEVPLPDAIINLATAITNAMNRYNNAVKTKTLTESFVIQDSNSNNKPVYFHYGKYTGYDWGFDKNAATKFSTKEAAERMIEKMRQEGMLINSMKVVSESVITESKTLKESFIIAGTSIEGKPLYVSSKDGKSSSLDKAKAVKFDSEKDAEETVEKMRRAGYHVGNLKVVSEAKKVVESYIKAYYRGPEHRLSKEGYVADKDGKMLAPWKTQAYNFGSESEAARAIKVIEKKPEWKDFTLVVEGRIARGYENLDADERAKHLLSHPSSKYMSDLKSENITERAIRKAVKEMLAQPDKRDPQFITDVNEEDCIKESSFYVKFSQDGKSSKYYTYANGKHGWTDNKSGATKFSTRDEAEASLKKNPYYDAFNMKYFEIVQEEGEAPAIANTTAEVANPELPLKLKEEDVEDSYKYQTSVAGGMRTDAETAESAQEYEDKTSLIKEHKSFRKFLKESLEDDKTKALEEYKQAKAKYLSDKSDENWKNYIEKKNVCMALGVRI